MNSSSEHGISDCLLLDLETDLAGRIIKIGALLGDRSHQRSGRFDHAEALGELDRLGADARCVAGHNLVRHDLAVLAKAAPGLKLLRLPVIDTLMLSPICFPENPYHRLVKDYKLVSESLSDPVSDARLAGVLLSDEIDSLRGVAAAAPLVFRCLRSLLGRATSSDSRLAHGVGLVFQEADGLPAMEEEQLLPTLRSLLSSLACGTAAASLDSESLSPDERRWEIGYALTWLRVAGADSILPPWVRLQFRGVAKLLSELRDIPCHDPTCGYCHSMHDSEIQIRHFFGFDGFRAKPADAAGHSLQQQIVEAGMRGDSLLAVMPTGGGKSICFQLPAMVRNLRRGVLTIVVSPLQALMKDQVDGLVRRTGHHSVAALNGLLTSPERGEVLRGIRMGKVAVLYVSPEQLRSRAFRAAVGSREIGGWVLDEAHCLSKWGHDFRPDYLYVGRFIRELAAGHGSGTPPIACFTATAKRDVIEEISDYFLRETGSQLARFEGGVERDNLRFTVVTIGAHAKLVRIDDLLQSKLPSDGTGTAIVFRARRRDAEETAEFLCQRGWAAEHFHAGLNPPEKKDVQDRFLAGETRVICATNAFGMGIDKDDVRIVIHGDIPGSLESYLQEAGRAGRDQHPAECVLLYDEEDCEQQFRLGAYSKLSRRDISQILRGLRRLAGRKREDVVVVTSGELLRDEDLVFEFDVLDRSADAKVRAAVSWLERAGLVERNENETHIVQARLLVKSVEEARRKLNKLDLSRREANRKP